MGFFEAVFGPGRDEIWNALRAQIGLYGVFAEALDRLAKIGVTSKNTRQR